MDWYIGWMDGWMDYWVGVWLAEGMTRWQVIWLTDLYYDNDNDTGDGDDDHGNDDDDDFDDNNGNGDGDDDYDGDDDDVSDSDDNACCVQAERRAMEAQLAAERERLEKMTQRLQDANRTDLEGKKLLAQLEAAKVTFLFTTSTNVLAFVTSTMCVCRGYTVYTCLCVWYSFCYLILLQRVCV